MNISDKSKDRLIISLIILLFIVIGISMTIAYFKNVYNSNDKLNTDIFKTTVTSVFDSPASFVPGDSVNADLKVKNEADIGVAVRASITETWYDKNNNILNNSVNNREVITKSIGNNWIYNNGYYYYNSILSKLDTTSSLIGMVTFNNVYSEPVCESSNGEMECLVGGKYAQGKYNIRVDFEMIQSDAYESEWGINLSNLS